MSLQLQSGTFRQRTRHSLQTTPSPPQSRTCPLHTGCRWLRTTALSQSDRCRQSIGCSLAERLCRRRSDTFRQRTRHSLQTTPSPPQSRTCPLHTGCRWLRTTALSQSDRCRQSIGCSLAERLCRRRSDTFQIRSCCMWSHPSGSRSFQHRIVGRSRWPTCRSLSGTFQRCRAHTPLTRAGQTLSGTYRHRIAHREKTQSDQLQSDKCRLSIGGIRRLLTYPNLFDMFQLYRVRTLPRKIDQSRSDRNRHRSRCNLLTLLAHCQSGRYLHRRENRQQRQSFRR